MKKRVNPLKQFAKDLGRPKHYFIMKYFGPVMIFLLAWGILSNLYLLSVNENDLDLNPGTVTYAGHEVEKGHIGHGINRTETKTKTFRLEVDYYKTYVLAENVYKGHMYTFKNGILVPTLEVGDHVEVYTYDHPAILLGVNPGYTVYKIARDGETIIPVSVVKDNIKTILWYVVAALFAVVLAYYLMYLRPKRKKQ